MSDKKIVRGFYFARKIENEEPVINEGKEVAAFECAKLPEYQTRTAAGADFFCAEASRDPLKRAMQQVAINTFFIVILGLKFYS